MSISSISITSTALALRVALALAFAQPPEAGSGPGLAPAPGTGSASEADADPPSAAGSLSSASEPDAVGSEGVTAPQGFAVSTRLEPDPSTIGDLLRYEVTVAFPPGHSINAPRTLDLAPLEVVSVTESDPETTGEGMRKQIRVELQGFELGAASVPPFELTRVGPGGEVQTLRVPAHPFEVSALLANEADPQLRPDDPPLSFDYPNEWAEAIIYGGLAGTALAGLALLAWLWWRRRSVPEVVAPPVPAHVQALEALAELEAAREPMLERGEFQEYYLYLTDIAKAYLEGRFGIDASDRTTDEIRRELMRQGSKIVPLTTDEVLRFLQDCDLVKFARFAPPLEEARAALLTVRAMVERTAPRPGPSGAQEAA